MLATAHGLMVETKFAALLVTVNVAITRCELEPLTFPRQLKPPARLTEDADSHQATSVSMHHLPHFFEAIDMYCSMA